MKETQKIKVEAKGNSQIIWGIPIFFAVRAGGWFMLAFAVMVLTAAWELTMGYPTKSFIALTLVLIALFCWRGYDLLMVARRKRYFTRVLVCQDIGLGKMTAQLKNFIDPTSQTPFRICKQASFIADDGMQVTFAFDRSRKFHIGAKYLFYFRLPPCNIDDVTAEHLEYLKIDHAILPNNMSRNF